MEAPSGSDGAFLVGGSKKSSPPCSASGDVYRAQWEFEFGKLGR
jgi:hypothetical protein